jgi:hypothetical protein
MSFSLFSEVGEDMIARLINVKPGRRDGTLSVSGGDGIKDALMLVDDVGYRHQLPGLGLANAHMNFAHDEAVHLC